MVGGIKKVGPEIQVHFTSEQEAKKRVQNINQLYDKLREIHGELKYGQKYELAYKDIPEYLKK